MTTANSNTATDFNDLLDSLKPDFDEGYATVPGRLEALFFAHLARKHGLSLEGIRAGFEHYCSQRGKLYRESKANS